MMEQMLGKSAAETVMGVAQYAHSHTKVKGVMGCYPGGSKKQKDYK